MSENYTYMNDGLLASYLLGEASPQERKQVEDWLQAGENNRSYFEEFRRVWEESRHLSAASVVDEEAAWKRFREKIHKPASIVSIRKDRSWLRIAAVFVLIAGAAILAYEWLAKASPVQQLALQSHNAVRIDTLPDGSVITLNKNSSLRFPEKFKGDKRTVSLEGEAFFNVTPDKKKPFEIQVNDVTVKVVGTSFNVRSENGRTEVIVETGIVQVWRNGRVAELHPGEKISVGQADSAMVPQKEKEQLYNYYRSREFVCDGTPLWKLVEVLNEAYDTHIVIEREELRNLPLDVTFSNESLDVILNIIRETFNTYHIEVVKNTDKISLR